MALTVLKGLFRYKDDDGEWHTVDAIRGQKGEKGETGETGASPTLRRWYITIPASGWKQTGYCTVSVDGITESTAATFALNPDGRDSDSCAKEEYVADYALIYSLHTQDGGIIAQTAYAGTANIPTHDIGIILEAFDGTTLEEVTVG